MNKRRRYAQIGLGGRHVMFRNAVIRDFSDSSEMVALCDSNQGRLDLSMRKAAELGGSPSAYPAEDFDRMIRETQPDCIIVTTMDCRHDEYICRAMEAGCDVITEKPMTIDEHRCQRILDTRKRTGKQCRVTFNYRYSPPRTQVKDLLMSGVIGNVLSVDFNWMLDTRHGADYFRRWHRRKENSGGLMVHKSTHHFDLINWWLSTVPEEVSAEGHRKFYTPQTAERYGLHDRGTRCHDCPASDRCPFFLDMAENRNLRELYLNCEQYDGYHRDGCVFSDEIDIEDSVVLTARYANGVKMGYSLNAFCPWEGYRVVINGSHGRLEHCCGESAYINADGSVPGEMDTKRTWTRIYPHWGEPYEEKLWSGKGGHGGGDPVLLGHIFQPESAAEDKYRRAADERSGAWSILTGIAVNHSIAEGRKVRIDELVRGLELPDYTDMPTEDDPLTWDGLRQSMVV